MTSTRGWGASPKDWQHFAATLGLREDLVCVVSNTTLAVRAGSQINPSQIGKVPSKLDQEGRVFGFAQWSQHHATAAEVTRWSKQPDLGICVIGRTVKAIDIDIADPVVAERVRAVVDLAVGALPVRRRANSGKCLLALRLPLELAKRVIHTEHGIIELLADRQQFIAVGTHPSGVRYEWEGEHADGSGLPAVIPEVSLAELEVLWSGLIEAFGLPGGAVTGRAGARPDKPRTAGDMADPAVDYLDEHGWVTEWAADGKIHVRCPWKAEHSSDNGPSETSYLPAGVGRDQPGFSCLHAHCQHRHVVDFLHAVGYAQEATAAEFDVVTPLAPLAAPARLEGAAVLLQPFESEEPWPNFERDKPGKIMPTVRNAEGALSRPDLCRARMGYDQFKAGVMIEWEDAQGEWRPMRDTDNFRLRGELERLGFKAPGRELVRDAIQRVAEIHQFDSATVWAGSLEWDQVPRAEMFFIDCFGVEDTPYTRACGKYVWSAMGGRALVPGVQADMIPVLLGGEGLRKTSGVKAMSPSLDMFVELSLDVKDDDLARKMRGKLVGELGELRGLAGKNAEAIRQWLTRREEEWIPKYGEFATRFLRRIVLLGTGNDREFLTDDGRAHRRWLPMTVLRQVDTARIERDRDQLWAEGVALFRGNGGEVVWEEAQALMQEVKAEYVQRDEWADRVEDWLARDAMDGLDGPSRGAGHFKSHEVLTSCLGFSASNAKRFDELRLANVLRGLGYERGSVRISAGAGGTTKAWKKVRSVDPFAGFA